MIARLGPASTDLRIVPDIDVALANDPPLVAFVLILWAIVDKDRGR